MFNGLFGFYECRRYRLAPRLGSLALALLFALAFAAPAFFTGSAQAAAPADQGSLASIESDPASLSSAGDVTISIKLRNPNVAGAAGGPVDDVTAQRSNLDHVTAQRSDLDTATTQAPSDPDETRPPVVTPPPATPAPQGGHFTNVSITSSYGITFQTADVPPSSTGVFRSVLHVSDEMIGQPLSFTISWYDTAASQTYHQALSLTIQRSDTTYLRLTRTASTTSASQGDKVVLTYTLVNTGTRRLNSITIVDEKIGGSSALFSPVSLESGEKKELSYTYTMRGASVVSKPTASFTPEGGSTRLSVTVSKITIGLVNAQLQKSVTVGTPTPNGVAFTLFLTNNGSQNLSGLVVKDDLGATLQSGFSLAIGESRMIEHFVENPSGVRNVVFYITGTYASGKQFSDNTKSYTVRPYIDPAMLSMRFTAEIKKPLDAENNISLNFTVQNNGRLPFTNVVLTEREMGYTLHDIQELAPSGEPASFSVDLRIDEPRELLFLLTALDPSGNTHTFEAHVNAQHVDLQSSIPNATPEPGANIGTTVVSLNVDKQINEKGQLLMRWWNTLKLVFFIALALIVVLGAVEFYLYRKSRSRRG